LNRIYLDNAATSWPKPESVYSAIDRFQREVGAASGRGMYKEVVDVLRLVEQTRQQVAEFIKGGDRHNIGFTYSGTDSLCTAIFGILRDGDHVVTSVAEHNSVLRPLHCLESQKRIEVTRVPCDATGRFHHVEVVKNIQSNTRLVVLTHVSNVTGAIQPIEPVGLHCQQEGITFLVDAAQSIGHLPIDVGNLGCDILAAPGHKGLIGPLGSGVLFYTDAVARRMTPLRYGGTGTIGGGDVQPEQLPDKFEAGNLNVPGIVGINAGIAFLNSQEGRQRLEAAEVLKRQMLEGILQIQGIKLHGPQQPDRRTGVFSVSFENMVCTDVAAALDTTWSIQTRAGLHCAPLLHRAIGTESAGGTVRLSIGLFNTEQEIELTLSALAELAAQISV
jgi:cysteine desulfurase/selenocysteine lyase